MSKDVDHEQAVYISANTDKDGLSDEYRLVCDANGKLVVAAVQINDGITEVDVLATGAENLTNTINALKVASHLLVYDVAGGNWNRLSGIDVGSESWAARMLPYSWDGANWVTLGISGATNRNLNVRIREGALTVDVHALTGFANDLDQMNALLSASVLFARVDNATVTPVKLSASGNDNESNEFSALHTAAFLYGFDGTNWDRLITELDDGSVATTQRALYTIGLCYGHNTVTGTNTKINMVICDTLARNLDSAYGLIAHALVSVRKNATTTTGVHSMGDESMSVARGHANSAVLSITDTNLADGGLSLGHNAVIDGTLDTYVYSIKIRLIDAADFFNAAGENGLIEIYCGDSMWDEVFGYDFGDQGTVLYDGNYYFSKSWNFATPYRIPANTTFIVYFVNASGNIIDSVQIKVCYYKE